MEQVFIEYAEFAESDEKFMGTLRTPGPGGHLLNADLPLPGGRSVLDKSIISNRGRKIRRLHGQIWSQFWSDWITEMR